MLDIVYVSFRLILCICYSCLRNLDSPWNIRQYKYNQVWCKVEN